MTNQGRNALLFLLLLGVAPTAAVPASRTGSVEFEGTRGSDRSMRSVESGILRGSPTSAQAVLSRTALHLFVAESDAAWDTHVATGLAKALDEGPEAVARFAEGVPGEIAQAGPSVDGGVLRFTLPDKRGEGVIAVYFPDLLDRSGRDLGRLDAEFPNQGLYASGVAVKRSKSDSPAFTGMYLPSRPKGLTRGQVPDVNLRELPGDGLGDLTIYNGKGASGDNADALTARMERLRADSKIQSDALRTFPKGKDDLAGTLRSSRSPQDVLVLDGGWYRTLAADPSGWTTESIKATHPSNYIAFSAPVVLSGPDGERVGSVILGGVAFYTPLMLGPEQARRYVNKSAPAFFASVQRGELAFFRDGDEVWFFRGHLDQWREGKGRQRRGRAWRSKEVSGRIKELAAESGSRRLVKAAGGLMPSRFEQIPAQEMAERDPGAPAVRARVYDGDLVGWLRHYDRKAELDGAAAVFALTSAAGGAAFEASFARGMPQAAPVASRIREGSGPLLEIVDVYPAEPTCAPGTPLLGVVEFIVDRIPDGEDAALTLSWSVSTGGPALARLSASMLRVAGEHEVRFEAGCPSSGRIAQLSVELAWEATGLSVASAATVNVGQ